MTRTTTTLHRPLAAAAFLAAAALALTGCAAASSTATPDAASAGLAADSVTVENAWVKAADSGMSAAFGEIENTGAGDVTIVSVASPASTALELHETVENETGEMTMREKGGGFTIAPGETLTLEPGDNHIMLMDLPEPVVAGDELSFTLTFSDESTLDFTAPAKDYAGANENYEDGDMEMDHSEMDHSEHGDDADNS
ncbi:copper chaperone PCu(A)C [Pseudoclavibacter terrae]|uniref:Copper chaperone PCu(A)C n=1 Tax=Pseudoclavibacter terrae TaxID=1530195 RepID=A0A7J5B6D4_9MICO|nr:copper chaperone PCu(A)C [Pseudoclavibacter terrae]KAB1638850.1 copper chaperone PCu(A)C [Pseudoclavibacter terrae]